MFRHPSTRNDDTAVGSILRREALHEDRVYLWNKPYADG